MIQNLLAIIIVLGAAYYLFQRAVRGKKGDGGCAGGGCGCGKS